MSLTIIYKKLQELKEKEKKIQDFYDPVKVHKLQHPHIQDLRDDYKEDIQNYGFSRFAFKEEQDNSFEEGSRKIQSASAAMSKASKLASLSAKKGTQESYGGPIKPQSAIVRPTTAKKPIVVQEAPQIPTDTLKMGSTIQSVFQNTIRPQTAAQQSFGSSATIMSRNIQSAMSQSGNRIHWGIDSINDRIVNDQQKMINEDDDQSLRPDLEEPDNEVSIGLKIAKHWKFTKKYDTNGKASVRNQSALKKIVVDGQGGEEEEMNEDYLRTQNQNRMQQRFNQQKIFISKEGEVLDTRHIREQVGPRRHSPTDQEENQFLDSFQSQRQFLFQDIVQSKKIYPPAPAKIEEENIGSTALRLQSHKSLDGNMTGNDLNSPQRLSSSKERGNHNNTTSSGSVKFFPAQKDQFSRVRPQTASASQLKTSLKAITPLQSSGRRSKSPSGSEPTVKLFSENEQKLSNMRKIKTVVLDRLGASKFFASRDFTPLELTEWYFANLRNNILKIFQNVTVDYNLLVFDNKKEKDFSFKVQVIDTKTMNFVKYENVKIINEKLYHTSYKDEAQEINFERIMVMLSKQHQPTHSLITPLSMFHILIYQKLSTTEETILFEKFIFKGQVQRSLEQNILNLLLAYYVRFLLCFDPSDIQFESIFNNSLFILERKRTVPTPFYDFFLKLQQKPIYVEDLTAKTTEQFIFPQLQAQLVVENQSRGNSFYANTGSSVMQEQAEFETVGFFQDKVPTENELNSSKIQRPLSAAGQHYPTENSRPFSPVGSAQNQWQPVSPQQFQLQMQRPQTAASQKNINIHTLNQLSRQSLGNSLGQFSAISKPAATLDYVKNTSQKQGLRPRTAAVKAAKSPSSSLSQLAELHKRHVLQNGFQDAWLPLDGRRYEKNIKTFSQPMFVKGQQVKPTQNRDNLQTVFYAH